MAQGEADPAQDPRIAWCRRARTLLSMAKSSRGEVPELKAWAAARTDAVRQVRRLAKAFKSSHHPQAARGIDLLRNVIDRQLTARPSTREQVEDLIRYVQTDGDIADIETPNAFGFSVDIRKPLLGALDGLLKQFA